MRRRLAFTLVIAGLIGAVAIPALATSHGPETNHKVRVATLTGNGETVPVDTPAAGLAVITVDNRKRLLCYEFVADGLDPVAVHIHEGAAGVDGPVVVDLGAFGDPIGNRSQGCTKSVSKDTIRAIRTNPTGYYVNVHTAAYPGGEIRGQLSR